MQQHPDRHIAAEIINAGLLAIWLPFKWIAWVAARLGSLLRRSGLAAEGQSARCASFDSSAWTPELLRHLEWRRFEELCAAYFETRGLGPSVVAQCRAWSPYPVDVGPLQELRGAMHAAGAHEGVLVSGGRFMPAAVKFAAREHIELIDGARFLRELIG